MPASEVATDHPLLLSKVLEEEYLALGGQLSESYLKKTTEKGRLADIYELIHPLQPKRSALCLSGGGIRSATFCLGVLQGLARLNLLDKFDYLSTVSGGGYIGSWLTAWIHRTEAQNVLEKLRSYPKSKIDPEPKEIIHLRTYSNYLSPKIGILSVDTWTLVAI